MSSDLISCVAWVKRGAAAQNPQKYVLDDEELVRISKLSRIELEDVEVELKRAQQAVLDMEHKQAGESDDADDGDEGEWVDEDESGADGGEDVEMNVDEAPSKKSKNSKNGEDDLAKYNLDDYDKGEEIGSTSIFSNIKGLTYYRNNEEDPYITLKDGDDDEEKDETKLLPSDNLVVTAKTVDEVSQLEIYVYDASNDNLYAHHDLMLPSFPLCLEWLDFPLRNTPKDDGEDVEMSNKEFANFIAVGTLDPEIEVWSLDVIDPMYPSTVLGRPPSAPPKAHIPTPLGTGKKKRKKSKHPEPNASHHVDAVLGLSWNRTHRNLLASASADRTVKLWDLSRDMNDEGGALRSWSLHADKVQSVHWNPLDPTVLLTGGYDRVVRTFDSRAPEAGLGVFVGADVESLKWDSWGGWGFYVALENGLVLYFDARALPSAPSAPNANSASAFPALPASSPALWTLAAHNGAASALDVSPHLRGCIVTGGDDKVVKVWNIDGVDEAATANQVNNPTKSGKRGKALKVANENPSVNVSLVTSRDLDVGKVFSATFSPDDPLTIAAAGSQAKVQIWDVTANANARRAFGAKLKEMGKELRERKEGEGEVVGLVDDREESDEE